MFVRAFRVSLSLVTMFALVACGGGGSSSATPATAANAAPAVNGPPVLPVIPEVASVNGVATLTLTAAFDSANRPAFFWNGQETAPTIRVQPGDHIALHFINSLPQYCAVGVASNSNLHFHGLTSSPLAPGDDVLTTNASPGSAVDYSIAINPDQPPGMYWYHPHPHGLSSWEVGNGMAGAIVVEGIANEVPATAGLRERVIVLGDVPTSNSYEAGEESTRRKSLALLRSQGTVSAKDDDEAGPTCSAETDATPTINGIHMASIGIKPGETELFRVVNASGHRHFDLSFDGLPLTLVAQDGVPIADYPGAPQSLPMQDIVIPPAGRAEFLITGAKQPVAMVSQCYNAGPAGDANPEVVLGELVDDSSWPIATQSNVTHVLAAKNTIRRPLFYREALGAPVAQRLISFEEDANGFYLNNVAYDPNSAPTITAQSGTVEEWTLQNNSDEAHVFHIHQIHFVVESVNGVTQHNQHWYDTFDIPPQGHGTSGQTIPSTVKVLMDFRDPVIRGIFVYHCHILDHEDGGMMAKIQVI